MDAIGRDAAEGRGRGRRLVPWALVLLLVLGVAADHALLDRERQALLASVADGERVVSASEDSLLSLADYVAPLLAGADVPAVTRRSALATLGRDAGRREPRLRQERSAVLRQRVLPWHGDVRAARDAYGERLGVWADELAQVRSQPQRLLDGGDGVRRSRQRAVRALLDAGADSARVRDLLGRGEAGPAGRR